MNSDEGEQMITGYRCNGILVGEAMLCRKGNVFEDRRGRLFGNWYNYYKKTFELGDHDKI